jgi:hypothetical protein
MKKNFGLIEVAFNEFNMSDSEVHLNVYSAKHEHIGAPPVLSKIIKFKELEYDESKVGKGECVLDNTLAKDRFISHALHSLKQQLLQGNFTLLFFLL